MTNIKCTATDGEHLRQEILLTEKGDENAALNVYLEVLKDMANYI